MKILLKSVVFTFILGIFSVANGQIYAYSQPRVAFGASTAMFRISLDDFENVYSNRWGPSYGAFFAVRAFGGNYVLLKYNNFKRSGKDGIHPVSNANLANARWNENWYAIGLRLHPPIERKFGSYYGFGIVFFDVNEEKDLTIFETSPNDEVGNGFFLELGIEYFPVSKMALFFETEISSGGIHGKTGFESMSIGGFRIAAGINFWPF